MNFKQELQTLNNRLDKYRGKMVSARQRNDRVIIAQFQTATSVNVYTWIVTWIRTNPFLNGFPTYNFTSKVHRPRYASIDSKYLLRNEILLQYLIVFHVSMTRSFVLWPQPFDKNSKDVIIQFATDIF